MRRATSPPPSPGRSSNRPVYYVQSPSHDGEKSMSLRSSPPVLSPVHYQSSVDRHSRESSSSQFSGSLKLVPRNALPVGPAAAVGGARKGDKAWNDQGEENIEEEGLLEGDDEERGFLRKCYVFVFMVAFLALFFLFALILWGVSRSQKPVIVMKSITFESFNIHAGTDASLMPTNIATLTSTLNFTYRNTASFFGVHVMTDTPISLRYYQLTMATGEVHKFYQSRKSKRKVSVVVSGSRVPLYGAGSGLSSGPGNTSVPVNLTLDVTLLSRAYVLGKLVKPKFYSDVRCSVVLDPRKLRKTFFLADSCQYN